jgi:hypothetical protein
MAWQVFGRPSRSFAPGQRISIGMKKHDLAGFGMIFRTRICLCSVDY